MLGIECSCCYAWTRRDESFSFVPTSGLMRPYNVCHTCVALIGRRWVGSLLKCQTCRVCNGCGHVHAMQGASDPTCPGGLVGNDAEDDGA